METHSGGSRNLTQLASNSLLLMGSFHRRGALLSIELQLLDMRKWSSLGMARVEAPYGDMPLVNAELTQRALELVQGLDFFSGVKIDEPLAREEVAAAEAAIEEMASTERYARQAPATSRELLHGPKTNDTSRWTGSKSWQIFIMKPINSSKQMDWSLDCITTGGK